MKEKKNTISPFNIMHWFSCSIQVVWVLCVQYNCIFLLCMKHSIAGICLI